MMADLQVLLEHLKLAFRHLPRHLQQASMDGSDLVLLEVGTGDKSPVVKLTVITTCFTQRCHGRVFRERKKLEIGEGRQLEDAAAKECDKKKTRRIKLVRGGREVQTEEWQDVKCVAVWWSWVEEGADTIIWRSCAVV
jgi:hypothetical protein